MIQTLRKFRGGQTKQIWGGASLETFSGEAQLKKSPCTFSILKVHKKGLKQGLWTKKTHVFKLMENPLILSIFLNSSIIAQHWKEKLTHLWWKKIGHKLFKKKIGEIPFHLNCSVSKYRYFVQTSHWSNMSIEWSRPRAKRAGPKGLRAESARAVTVQ